MSDYYGLPLLKAPVWEIDIPVYYFLGGAAGAALLLGAAAQLDGSDELDRLAQRCHWIGIVGATTGAALLIHDLGRPARFLNMLRVFRPTSPMNMGVWILSGAAPLAITAGLCTGRGGWLGAAGKAAGYGAGLFGVALAGYTGVLVGNTAIPVYQRTRHWMPVLFLASGAATAASVLDVISEEPRAARITSSFGTAGRVAELAAAYAMEQITASRARLGLPLRRGVSGAFWRAAKVLTVTSLILAVAPGKSRSRRKWAGVLGSAGSLCLRLAVHYAGGASSRDPQAVFETQRQLSRY